MATKPYDGFRLWLRVYDKRNITEDGVYAENELPDSYGGSVLVVEYPQLVVFGNSIGTVQEFAMMDFYDVMDKDDNTGVGFQYTLYGETITTPASSPSTVVMPGYVKFYNEESSFTVAEHAKLEQQYKYYMRARGLNPD